MKRFKSIGIIMALIICCGITYAAQDPITIELGHCEQFAIFAEDSISSFGENKVYGDIGLWGNKVEAPRIIGSHIGQRYGDSELTYSVQKDLIGVIDYIKSLKATSTTTGNTNEQVFKTGVYDAPNGIMISNSMTLDAENSPDAYFVFRTNSIDTLKSANIWLINGAKPEQVFWLVEGTVLIKEDSKIVGNIIAMKDIELERNTSINGRLISLTTLVKINNSVVNRPEIIKKDPVRQKQVIKLIIGDINALVDGTKKVMDVAPKIKNGYTFVPLSFISNEMGAKTTFTKNATGKVEVIIIEFEDVQALVKIGSNQINVNYSGNSRVIEAGGTAYIENGRTMVPFKAIANLMNAKVTYQMTEDDSRVESVQFEKDL